MNLSIRTMKNLLAHTAMIVALISQAEQDAAVDEQVEQAEVVAEEGATTVAQNQMPGMSDADAELARRENMRPSVTVSDGSRIDIPEKGFSIIPPSGWEVHHNYPGSTLMFQVPKRDAKVYQRTIHVNSMVGPKAIDEITAKEFDELIVKNFTKNSAALENFKLRNHVFVDLPTGNKGILFYTEFLLTGEPMMQVHILTSSSDRHFLMTFTDLAKNFEGGSDSPVLNTAWESMTSIEVSGQPPGRYNFITQVLGSVGFILLLTVGIALYRRMSATSKYKQMADEANESDLSSSDNHHHTKQDSWHSHQKID